MIFCAMICPGCTTTEKLNLIATMPVLAALVGAFWPERLLPKGLRSPQREWGVRLLVTSPILWACIYLVQKIRACSGTQDCLDQWGGIPLNVATAVVVVATLAALIKIWRKVANQ
jgi:hypothetical protein